MNNGQNFDPMTGQPINNGVSQPQSQPQNVQTYAEPVNNGGGKKPGLIILGVLVGFVVLGFIIFFVISSNSNKFVCTSSQGNITLMYNDKGLTGYRANGIDYDYDGQSDYAKQVGIEQYLNEFSAMFSQNFSGVCEKK